MVKDPVCGMMVNEAEATEKSEYNEKIYYFCAAHCKMQFDKEPEKYISDPDMNNMNEHQHHHHH